MATASSVQREPSMEEILASIRRIIEDSDPGRKPAEGFAHKSDDAGIPDEPAAAVVDVFRNELRSGTEAVPLKAPVDVETPKEAQEASLQQPEAASSDSRSQDDRLSSSSSFKRIDFTRTDLSRPADPVSGKLRAKPDDWLVPLDVGAADKDVHFTDPKALPADAAPKASLHNVQRNPAEETVATEKNDAAPAQSASFSADANADFAAKPALVSEKTSRQVAASFGELSDAFAARSKKSLDEMAEEMLRPMLQDWLDNNLPTLVERLVREEIERVARGG